MEVSSQLHAPTTLPLESDPETHVTGGCVGPGASVDGFWDKQIFACARIPNPDWPAHN